MKRSLRKRMIPPPPPSLSQGEALETRVAPAVLFDALTSLLTVGGDENGPANDVLGVFATDHGFVEVKMNNAVHSSDPASAHYNASLAGATVQATSFIQMSGGEGNDLLYVVGDFSHARFTLDGGNGNDSLMASSGQDTLIGGAGDDTYFFNNPELGSVLIVEEPDGGRDQLHFGGHSLPGLPFSRNFPGGIVLNLSLISPQAVLDQHLTLILSSGEAIEDVEGTVYADFIVGNSLNNMLSGGSGNDTLVAGSGDNVLLGGNGGDTYVFRGYNLGHNVITEADNRDVDTLDFSGLAGGIRIHLGETQMQLVSAAVNFRFTLSSATAIENVVGTVFADWIHGNERDNLFRLGPGNDTIHGDDGEDWVDFSNSDRGVTVNLAKGWAKGLDKKQLSSIEHVLGSSFADKITGNQFNNILIGGGGNDKIATGGGNNLVIGGNGRDLLKSGRGHNLLIGGSATYDAIPAADLAILKEWTSGKDYSVRVANLTDGSGSADRVNKSFFLVPGVTVHADGLDKIAGASALDWIL